MYLNDAGADAIQHGSKESPITIQEKDTNRQVGWEYEHIRRTIGPYKFHGQALLLVGAKHLDLVTVLDRSGKTHKFYFDISSKLDKEGKDLERVWEDMKKHPEKLPPEMRALIEDAKARGW